jgi:hypothetical protein
MNAMSNPTPQNLENLKFYAVPASWLVKVWPILSYRSGLDSLNEVPSKDVVGKILNAELVVVETGRDVTDEEDEDDKKAAGLARNGSNNNHNQNTTFDQAKVSMERFHRRQMAQRVKTTKLIPGLRHAKDYFFLGERVWEIVKIKFGYDGYEICRSSCKAPVTTASREEEQGTIAIALLPGEGAHSVAAAENSQAAGAGAQSSWAANECVVIPATGRFPYEKILPALTIHDLGNPVLDSMIDEKNNNVVSS